MFPSGIVSCEINEYKLSRRRKAVRNRHYVRVKNEENRF